MTERDEEAFLAALAADPDDKEARSRYADWLEERGARGEYLRLTRLLAALDPDHLQRPEAEERLSVARRNVDRSWLAKVEPSPGEHRCFRRNEQGEHTESQFHREAQDTRCDVWKRLLDLIEDTSAHGGGELNVFEVPQTPEERAQLITLPSTIGKLTSVTSLVSCK